MKSLPLCLSIIISVGACTLSAQERFEPTPESVSKRNDAPEWLKDAKFGIYTHWGPQTFLGDLPVSGSIGYYNQMYDKNSAVHKYHVENYGDPKEVGYKDMVDHFKAEKFDANAWADIFYDAGARFGGMVVIHHDNFVMTDSDIFPVNVVNKGPKRDITGELAEAYRARGMNFIATFHAFGAWTHSFLHSYDYDGADPAYVSFYNEPHKKGDKPPRVYLDRHVNYVKEVVERYKPSAIWFDYGLYNTLHEKDRFGLAAWYYNWGLDHDEPEAIFIHKHGDKFPTGILNTERGRRGYMMEKTWMNDESIGIRYWYLNEERKKAAGSFTGENLTHVIIDLASKNGTFLLNVAPDKHGVIPEDQRTALKAIGDWLKVYGEAIYSTRPWVSYGEGPLQVRFPGKLAGGKFPEHRDYTTRDIRFTRSKDNAVIYATFMGVPKADIPIRSMVVTKPALLKQARWLGQGPVAIAVNADGHPVVDLSSVDLAAVQDHFAYSIAIPAEAVRFNDQLNLQKLVQIDCSVDTARLHGDSIDLITIDADDGIRSIEPWTDPADYVSWEVKLPAAGHYALEVALTARSPSKAMVHLAGQKRERAVHATVKRGKLHAHTQDFGVFKVDKAGTHTLEIRAAKLNGKWRPFQIRHVRLKQLP